MTEQWALCWSRSQNTLHVETLAQHTSRNREAYAENRPGDYRLLLVGTHAEVYATAASIQPTLASRDALRSAGVAA